MGLIRRTLILSSVSNKNLLKVIPPILLVIMDALGSHFFINREFIIIELVVSLNCIFFGAPMGCAYIPLRNCV